MKRWIAELVDAKSKIDAIVAAGGSWRTSSSSAAPSGWLRTRVKMNGRFMCEIH